MFHGMFHSVLHCVNMYNLRLSYKVYYICLLFVFNNRVLQLGAVIFAPFRKLTTEVKL